MRTTASDTTPRRPRIHRALHVALFLGCVLTAFAADTPRTLLVQSKPVYPEIARQMRIHGVLVIEVTVLPDGQVGSVKIQSGHPLLLRAAEDAVRKWRYSPAPETTTLSIQIDFQEIR